MAVLGWINRRLPVAARETRFFRKGKFKKGCKIREYQSGVLIVSLLLAWRVMVLGPIPTPKKSSASKSNPVHKNLTKRSNKPTSSQPKSGILSFQNPIWARAHPFQNQFTNSMGIPHFHMNLFGFIFLPNQITRGNSPYAPLACPGGALPFQIIGGMVRNPLGRDRLSRFRPSREPPCP